MTRDFRLAALVALALTLVGIFTHGGVPSPSQTVVTAYASDSDLYLSMAAHRNITRPPDPRDPRWSLLSDVRLPFRYRVLVPWLASLLPFGAPFSLALVNWTGIAGAYIFVLLTSRRLGLSFVASAAGLAVAFTLLSGMQIFGFPWLTDGFVLFILAGMTYAFVADNFWLFSAFGLAGLFAREAPAVLLPLWGVRDWKRAAVVTAVAAIFIVGERAVLSDPNDFLNPDETLNTGLTISMLLHPASWPGVMADLLRHGPPGASFWPGVRWPPNHLRTLLTNIEGSWGWAFPLLVLGLWLAPREAMRPAWPIFGLLTVLAFGMSIIATDVSREFMVLLPVVVFGLATVINALATRRQYAWLALLAALAAAQFCLSEPRVVLRNDLWIVWSARVPMVKIGVAWAIGAALLLRRDIAGQSRGRESPRGAPA